MRFAICGYRASAMTILGGSAAPRAMAQNATTPPKLTSSKGLLDPPLRPNNRAYCGSCMTPQVLAGKTGVVFGVANKRSIAWAIAKAWAGAGAKLIFNYQGERLKENVEELVGEFGGKTALFPCEVSSDDEIASFFEKVKGETDHVDLMLHSLAFAPKEALEGDFLSTAREAF